MTDITYYDIIEELTKLNSSTPDYNIAHSTDVDFLREVKIRLNMIKDKLSPLVSILCEQNRIKYIDNYEKKQLIEKENEEIRSLAKYNSIDVDKIISYLEILNNTSGRKEILPGKIISVRRIKLGNPILNITTSSGKISLDVNLIDRIIASKQLDLTDKQIRTLIDDVKKVFE